MKPDKVTVYDLFDKQRQYVVPLYQRQYVWTKENQWLPLWEDVSEKALRVQRNEVTGAHFLGAIVTSQRQVFGNEMSSWEIIDGQQRLTTLQVLLTAFKDVAHANGESGYDVDFRRLTRNEGVMEAPTEQFKVWPTNVDRKPFEAVMTASGLEGIADIYPGLRGRQQRQIPRIVEAYAFFYQRLTTFVEGAETDESAGTPSERIRALWATFKRHLHIVNIELEADDDPQVIFESLNGRGVPLLPSDLVRNFVFMRATKEKVDLDALYGRYWRQYDEWRNLDSRDPTPWWKQEERQGRIKRPRLDLFLFHYLQYRLQEDVSITHLFQEFRKWWEGQKVPSAETLAEIQRFADAYIDLVEPQGQSRAARFSRWLRVLDNTTVYPFVFFVLIERASALSEGERDGILDDLESFLLRRAVCGLTSKQYNRYFLMLLRNVKAGGGLSRENVRAQLSAGRGDSVRWPDDEEFGRAFLFRPVYKAMKQAVSAALLRDLEDALVTTKHEKLLIVDDLSIEHIMPQSWEKNWPIQDSSDEARERRERLLHTVGNLAFVTTQFNTSLSNREFDRKQKEFKRTTRLLLNRMIEDVAGWDEDAILLRGRDLFDAARRRWPHPDSPELVDDVALEMRPDAAWERKKAPEDDEEMVLPPVDVASARSLLDAFASLAGSAPQA